MHFKKKLPVGLLVLMGVGLVPYYMFCWGIVGGWVFECIISPLWQATFPSDSNAMLWGFVFWIFSMALCHVLFFLPYFIICAIIIAVVRVKSCSSTPP